MNIKKYDADLYDLRKKQTKRSYKQNHGANGEELCEYFFPHLQITAREYARTRKFFRGFRELIKSNPMNKKPYTFDRDLYRFYILPSLESSLRNVKQVEKTIKAQNQRKKAHISDRNKKNDKSIV